MSIINNASTVKSLIDSKSLLVFDFDGVIADSVEIKTQAFAALYESYGNDIVNKVVNHHKNHGGVSRFEKLKKYHTEFLGVPLNESKLIDLCNKFSKLVVDKVIAANEIPGVMDFIEKNCSGKKICVVNSATPTDEISTIVEKKGLTSFFSAVYGSPTGKKENLNNSLAEFDVSVNDSVFFGDAESDFMASTDVGVDFIYIGEACNKPFSEGDTLIYNATDFLKL